MATKIINLEQGLPKVENAMFKLRLELSTLKKSGVKHIKIIHGYGSGGTGGAIKAATQQYLREQLRENRIKAFCPGDNFGPFENNGRDIVNLAPALRRDPDWGRQNDGITIVII
ncbi:MAG: hypothetical protein PWP10_2923 [Clostridiales bacterium]|jgi:hypothetical protein|nr:hypothetical protein [Clostridiales bacterium]